MTREILRYYRTAEGVARYSLGEPTRSQELAALFHAQRRYFGRRVLDLACGGGVLGFLLEKEGRECVGVDANPDMLREAGRAARDLGSHVRFLLGDATELRVTGRFDTVTILGNALSHLTAREFARLLGTRRRNVRRGSHLIVEYRDTVAMFARALWKSPYRETHKGGTTVHRTRSVDTTRGVIHVRARRGREWTVDFTQKIWSPFLVEALAVDHGWTLVRRQENRRQWSWTEVYRYGGPDG